MSFKPKDVVWVPSSIVPFGEIEEKCQYWPAKFIKQTNRPDICLVSLFNNNNIQNRQEQYLVDTQLIVAFQAYQICNPTPSLKKAYQSALKQHKKSKQTELIKQQTISNSRQFCQFIHNCLSIELIKNPNQSATENRTKMIAPKFNCKQGLPLQTQDLNLYFNQKIPQILSFLIQSPSPKSLNFLSFLKQAKIKITNGIIKGLKNHQLKLIQ